MTFDVVFDRVLGVEGGFSDDPKDPGNWTGGSPGVGELKGTNWGISAASYPNLDVRALTRDDAKQVYFRDFWTPITADGLPDSVSFQLFDFAVNSGIGTAIRYLQRAIGVADDGKFGPVSQAAAAAMPAWRLIVKLDAERLDFMTRLSNWPSAGKGWARRIATDLLDAAEDV